MCVCARVRVSAFVCRHTSHNIIHITSQQINNLKTKLKTQQLQLNTHMKPAIKWFYFHSNDNEVEKDIAAAAAAAEEKKRRPR